MNAAAVVVIAYLAGSIPFSNVFARRLRGIDLRTVGSRTVSGTALYRVAGFGPLVAAGVLDIAKGAAGPALAAGRPLLGAAAAAAAVAGHAWSVWLGGAGGRGVSPAMGALLVLAWPGAVVLLAGLVFGRLVNHTALGSFAADLALVPLLALTHGGAGIATALGVLVPLLAKRLAGNAAPSPGTGTRVYVNRLLFDADRRVEQ